MADLHCYIAEVNTTLKINDIPFKKKKDKNSKDCGAVWGREGKGVWEEE